LSYGDILVDSANYQQLVSLPDDVAAIISVKKNEDVSHGGAVFFNDRFELTDLREKPKPGEPTSPWYNAGVYAFRPNIFEYTSRLKPSPRGEYELTDAIRELGERIAIDDFGTGFSSLGYLAKLPVDTLKIDRSFVSEMTASQGGLALVSTIINLAHSLKLNVVAEGVETEEQTRLLRLLNCDEMQGFLFSKPVPVEVFETRFLGGPCG